MKTIAALLSLLGMIVSALGVASLINAAFGLNMRYRGSDLPQDLPGATLVLVSGLLLFGIGWLIDRRKKIAG